MAASANDRMSEHLCLPLWPNLQPPLCPSASEVLKTPVSAMGRDPGAVQSGRAGAVTGSRASRRGRSHQAIRKSEKGGPTSHPASLPLPPQPGGPGRGSRPASEPLAGRSPGSGPVSRDRPHAEGCPFICILCLHTYAALQLSSAQHLRQQSASVALKLLGLV